MKVILRFLCAASLIFGSSARSVATTVSFPDFSSAAGLTLNGNAQIVTTGDGHVLRLTPASGSKSGSAFSSTTINASNFSTFFTFRITDPGGTLFDGNTETGADGLVFVIQAISSSLGGNGQGIGYAGITPSVGVEFDTWHNSANNDPNSNHIGIDLNGNVNHGSNAPFTVDITPRFDDGNLWYAWIDYDSTNLEVRANQTGVRPAASILSRPLDVASLLYVTDAYVGFTSGTGADWGNHDIVSWEYRDTFNPITNPVPEPSTILLFGTGMVGLAACGRRRRKT